MRVIDAEVARNEQIRLAEQAARKKSAEVKARREAANRV
jgi:hypothetical protein